MTVAVDTEQLRSTFRGPIITPEDDGYDQARKVWNGMIDRRPAIVARCTGVADVIAAVRFARENHLLIAVRGGGHSFPGHSVCDDGIVIDLSAMKGVRVNWERRTVHVQAGATWGDLDHETQAFGLAVPGGVVSTTGIAGLTLGGGTQSWLARKYGITVDNLLSADVVTADGYYLRASAEENPDLHWALRGGGGNFGIVTSFEYALHPVGPTVLAGAAFYPWQRAREVARFYLDYVRDIPDELTSALYLWTLPPAPFLPESAHNKMFAVIALCYAGAPEVGERVIAPVRALQPEVDMVMPMPYTVLQSMFDAIVPKGILAYSKSDYFDEISDWMVEEMVLRAESRPSPLTLIHLNHYGGAVSRIGGDATSFGHRGAQFALSAASLWTDPAQTDANVRWTQDCWGAMRKFGPRGAYVNFLSDEGQDRIRESYGTNYERLAEIKAKYDPDNVFRLNQNIQPAHPTG